MIDIETIASKIVAAAMKVHTVLGPGLLESAYQKCMQYELQNNGFKVQCEAALPIVYEKITIDAGYRIDMTVADIVIIENKTVEKLQPIHEAQLLTYLKLRNCKLGFLLNWNVPRMKDGIKRMVNNLCMSRLVVKISSRPLRLRGNEFVWLRFAYLLQPISCRRTTYLHHPGTAWPQRRADDDDLHSLRAEQDAQGTEKPAGFLTVICPSVTSMI